ncbi:MAG: conjugal transfer transcriptional regulator TraJ [Nitrosomonas sp.]|nr:conjugal transfer transcriptional regulator TraJ [Nitrosomonas sp.]
MKREKTQTPENNDLEPSNAEEKNKKITRKYKLHLRVPVDAEEDKLIKEGASECGISVSHYLKMLGIGYQPKSIVDNYQVKELAKINGDLGRLGGLLKLWLSDDKKAAGFDRAMIVRLLRDMEKTRVEMNEVMMKIIKSGY